MSDSQTEARASLWVPAKPEHAKLGWTYDFEQTERIARAAYDSTGRRPAMEVVEFVMAEADRRYATALATERAAIAEARKALDALGAFAFWFQNYPEFKPNPDMQAEMLADLDRARPFIPARRALTGGKEDG